MAYRIAITGSSGQLGTVLIESLLEDPELAEVRAVDVTPARVEDPRVRHYQRDVREPGLEAIFEGCDAVFHLAFVVFRYMPREEYDAINVDGSKNVLEAAAKACVPYLLCMWSTAAYGVVPGHPDPIDETTPLRFQLDFPYPAAKYKVESFLDDLERRYPDMKITRLRPVIVIGPNDKGPTTASLRKHVILHYRRNPNPIVWEGDVAQAVLLAFWKRAHGVFVLTTEDPLAPPQLAAAAGLRCIRIPPRLWRRYGVHMKRMARWRTPPVDPNWLLHDVRVRPTSRKAREELGWRPECPTCADVVKRFVKEVPNEAGPAERVLHQALAFVTGILVR